MPPTRRDTPYPAHNFQILVTGVSNDGAAVSGSFTEISGLEIEMKTIEYRNGSESLWSRKQPGRPECKPLTCKRGIIGDPGFFNWIQRAIDGDVQRADGSVILNDETQTEVMRWNFTDGWPCKYTISSLNATNNEVLMETLEICFRELKLDV